MLKSHVPRQGRIARSVHVHPITAAQLPINISIGAVLLVIKIVLPK